MRFATWVGLVLAGLVAYWGATTPEVVPREPNWLPVLIVVAAVFAIVVGLLGIGIDFVGWLSRRMAGRRETPMPEKRASRPSFIHFEGGQGVDIKGIAFRTIDSRDGISSAETDDLTVQNTEYTNLTPQGEMPAAVRLHGGRRGQVIRPSVRGRADGVNATDHDDLLVIEPRLDTDEASSRPNRAVRRRKKK